MTKSAILKVRAIQISMHKRNHTCVCNGCISSPYPGTNGAADTGTSYRSNMQKVELRESVKGRRTLRSDFAPVYQTGTTCRWPSRRSMHARRLLCVANCTSAIKSNPQRGYGIYLNVMRFIKNQAMEMDRMDHTFGNVK